jgi:hypothetical protein
MLLVIQAAPLNIHNENFEFETLDQGTRKITRGTLNMQPLLFLERGGLLLMQKVLILPLIFRELKRGGLKFELIWIILSITLFYERLNQFLMLTKR